MQEHQDTSQNVQIVEHKDDDHYIVNGQALHNVHLMRAVFPHMLFTIPNSTNDCKVLHTDLATKLRAMKDHQKAATKAHREAVKALTGPKEWQTWTHRYYTKANIDIY